MNDIDNLTKLGSNNTTYIYKSPNHTILETFVNSFQNRDYITEFIFPEFTSLCPKTGQPDFATIHIQYIPNIYCIETKSLKLYFMAFRQYNSFMESIVNKILEDCVYISFPKWMKVIGDFNLRGGTQIKVTAEHHA